MAKPIHRVPEIRNTIPGEPMVHRPAQHAAASVARNAADKLGSDVQRGSGNHALASRHNRGTGTGHLALQNSPVRRSQPTGQQSTPASRAAQHGRSPGIIDGEYRVLNEAPPVRSRPVNTHERRGQSGVPSAGHRSPRLTTGMGRTIRWGFYTFLYQLSHLGYWITLFFTTGEFRERELAKYPAHLIVIYGTAALLCLLIVFGWQGAKLYAWLEERKRTQEQQNARQFDTTDLAKSDRVGYIIGGAKDGL